MTIQRFEDLTIWQESRSLCISIYSLFKENKDWGFKDQIQRAAVSIMNNIAEGFNRNLSTKDNKQLILYLTFANGSCGEVKSMLYLAHDLFDVDENVVRQLQNKCISVSTKIANMIVTLRNNNGQNNRIKG